MSNHGSVTGEQISGNDWGPLRPRADGARPNRSVTVVICDAPDQKRLDPTLAALRHQDYPGDLFEVVVVAPVDAPIELPDIRPDRCRLIDPGDVYLGGGGFEAAVAAGSGEIVVRLAAGVICARGFLSTLVRWQHASPQTVSLALPARLTQGWTEAADVTEAAAGDLTVLFPAGTVAVNSGSAAPLASSHDLRTAGHLAFQSVREAPFAFDRSYYSGGDDPYRGDDVEVAYRLAQAGAVFVPEPAAQCWALPGDDDAARARLRRATLPDLVPYPRNRRPVGRSWSVPLVTAVVPANGPYEMIRACVDRLLGSDETDLRVLVVGDWNGDSHVDQHLLAAEYRSEQRVRLVNAEPETVFPSPYLLRVPSRLGLGSATLTAILAVSERWQAGLVRVLPAGAASAMHAIELWSTAARSRAQRAGVPASDLAAAVAASHGQRWESGSEFDVVDLGAVPPDKLASASARAPWPAGKGGEQTVPVGGARSLVRATAFVARRYATAAKRRVVHR